MKSINVFSINDLSIHSNKFIQYIDKGEMSLVTTKNSPSFIAIPFNHRLLVHGINITMAINLFETGVITISQAANIANLSIESFIELLGDEAVAVVDYSPEELLLEINDI